MVRWTMRFAKPVQVIRRVWPRTIVALGLGLSAAWAGLLGYGLLILLDLAIAD